MLGKYLNELSLLLLLLHATDCLDGLKQQKKSLLRAVVWSACTYWHESSLFIYLIFSFQLFSRGICDSLFEQ